MHASTKGLLRPYKIKLIGYNKLLFLSSLRVCVLENIFKKNVFLIFCHILLVKILKKSKFLESEKTYISN